MDAADVARTWVLDGATVVAAVDGIDGEGVVVARSGSFYVEAFDREGRRALVVMDAAAAERLARSVLMEVWS